MGEDRRTNAGILGRKGQMLISIRAVQFLECRVLNAAVLLRILPEFTHLTGLKFNTLSWLCYSMLFFFSCNSPGLNPGFRSQPRNLRNKNFLVVLSSWGSLRPKLSRCNFGMFGNFFNASLNILGWRLNNS